MKSFKVFSVFLFVIIISSLIKSPINALSEDNELKWEKVVGQGASVESGFGDPANTAVTSLSTLKSALYATTWNVNSGTEVWKSSDGKNWHQVNQDGFGDYKNVDIHTIIKFKDNLYLGTDNAGTQPDGNEYPGTGAEIFKSNDGEKWTRVIGKNLAGSNGPGFGNSDNNEFHTLVVFGKFLYVSSCNYDTGMEIWRTSDGIKWDKLVGHSLKGTNAAGFGNRDNYDSSMIVYNSHLYASTWNRSTGTEIWRSSDGKKWEQVSKNGFGNNAHWMGISFAVFKSNLYVGTWSKGAEAGIWSSSDGNSWNRANANGFGYQDSTTISVLFPFDNYLYAGIKSEIKGGMIQRTKDGNNWEKYETIKANPPNVGYTAFSVFNDYLYVATDNTKGTEIWRAEIKTEKAKVESKKEPEKEKIVKVKKEKDNNLLTIALIIGLVIFLVSILIIIIILNKRKS